ncbi:carboxymuconolactone decarboxylase family protein [Bowmanella sp. Y26]|uniref:carboxymuconolactone decarboxylase family protein n=1 Tax=Bowmanella yangjiangensis TaxID=2811230 RepID=UPI001BDDC202|nr:carboxymuconolactone decarboxylase family protein [Bowmanella yangjiangensis]MBT1063565.1 carboxymuconolactone decarboxylase family protein [Bowmanella yangjiangensis]
MSFRVNFYQSAPGAIQAMMGLENYISKLADTPEGLPKSLLELVKMRVSQINNCAFCLDMHSKDARAMGETEQRLYLLNAWQESPMYTQQERAALEWCEVLTRLSQVSVTEDCFERVKRHFTDKQMTDLTLAINAINGWNRLCVGLGADVGSYQVGQFD